MSDDEKSDDEKSEMWLALTPLASYRGASHRSRVHNALTNWSIVTPRQLRLLGLNRLLPIKNLGCGSIHDLARAGLLGEEATREALATLGRFAARINRGKTTEAHGKPDDPSAELWARVENLELGLIRATGGWENLIRMIQGMIQAREGEPRGRELWDDTLRIVARLRGLATGDRATTSLAAHVAEIEAAIDQHPDRHPDERDETEAAEATQLIARLREIVSRRRREKATHRDALAISDGKDEETKGT